MSIRVGTAGWALRRSDFALFASHGSHLERYASRFQCVENNSSFYRAHKKSTYARWAAAVPEDFRFSVKLPKQVTHVKRLTDCASELDRFLDEVSGLDNRLGPLLVQLPPSLNWSESLTIEFFSALRRRFAGLVVCEPRHLSWFRPEPATQLG